MSSIDNKPTGRPSFDLQNQAGQAIGEDPNAAQGVQPASHVAPAAAPQGAVGLSAAQLAQMAKMSGAGSLLATPPPLPPGRGTIGPDTAQHYQSLMQDVGDALAKGMPAGHAGVMPFTLAALATDPSTEAGKAQLHAEASKVVTGSIDTLNATNDAAMMAAFLELNVKNAASGKELQANLMNMASEARNNLIKQSTAEREQQAAALKKAEQKQKALGPLLTIFKVIVLVVSAVAAALTFGGAAVAVAMLVGALAGGAAKGAKNGKGFDLSGALDGAGYALDALGLAALAKVLVESLTKALTRAGDKAAARRAAGGDSALRKAGDVVVSGSAHVLKKASEKGTLAAELAAKEAKRLQAAIDAVANKTGVGMAARGVPGFEYTKSVLGNLGKPFLTGDEAMKLTAAQGALSVVQAVQTIAQAAADYAHTAKLLEAKTHEANAKGLNALVDDAQARWESMQSSVQAISDAHSRAADQSLEMVNRHHATAQKAVRLISG